MKCQHKFSLPTQPLPLPPCLSSTVDGSLRLLRRIVTSSQQRFSEECRQAGVPSLQAVNVNPKYLKQNDYNSPLTTLSILLCHIQYEFSTTRPTSRQSDPFPSSPNNPSAPIHKRQDHRTDRSPRQCIQSRTSGGEGSRCCN